MARKKALGLIKRSRKATTAASKRPGAWRTRNVKMTLEVYRDGALYGASLCLPSASAINGRMKPGARSARNQRGAFRCGVGFASTPTKATAEAAREFAKHVGQRK